MDEMTAMHDALKASVVKLKEKKAGQDAVKALYAKKEKVKPLTTAERLARIEELLGL